MSEHLTILYAFGRFLSPFYAFTMSLRASFYRKGLIRSHTLPVPVVSVGNLTMGGTGKTPMTIYLARLLSEMNPAVVSRGYGGKAKGRVNVVSNGKSVCLDSSIAGDEPFYIAENLPGVPVVTSKNRVMGSDYAIENFQAGAIILDDGFQHLAMARNLDVVLFKVDTFLGNNRVFPGGDMREPLKALERADCFVLNCVDEKNAKRADAIESALTAKFPSIPVFRSQYRAVSLKAQGGEELDLAEKPSSLFAFCGLADPLSFRRSLELAGVQPVDFLTFRDHCKYFHPEINFLKKRLKKCGPVAGLITSEKDMVKLGTIDLGLPLYALRMEIVPEEGFDHFVLSRLTRLK